MLAGQFNRRRQWPRVAAGTVAGLAYIGVAYSLGGLQTDNPELVAAFYALPFVASAAAALVMTVQRWPRLPRAAAATTA